MSQMFSVRSWRDMYMNQWLNVGEYLLGMGDGICQAVVGSDAPKIPISHWNLEIIYGTSDSLPINGGEVFLMLMMVPVLKRLLDGRYVEVCYFFHPRHLRESWTKLERELFEPHSFFHDQLRNILSPSQECTATGKDISIRFTPLDLLLSLVESSDNTRRILHMPVSEIDKGIQKLWGEDYPHIPFPTRIYSVPGSTGPRVIKISDDPKTYGGESLISLFGPLGWGHQRERKPAGRFFYFSLGLVAASLLKKQPFLPIIILPRNNKGGVLTAFFAALRMVGEMTGKKIDITPIMSGSVNIGFVVGCRVVVVQPRVLKFLTESQRVVEATTGKSRLAPPQLLFELIEMEMLPPQTVREIASLLFRPDVDIPLVVSFDVDSQRSHINPANKVRVGDEERFKDMG